MFQYGSWNKITTNQPPREEIAVLDGDAAAAHAAERADDEALRDQWLAMLKEGLKSDAQAGSTAAAAASPSRSREPSSGSR